MIEKWGVVAMDETLLGVSDTKEQAQGYIDSQMFDLGMKVVTVKIDDTPPDERTEELKSLIEEAYERHGVVNLHISKGVKFYEQPINDRLEMVLRLIEERGEPVENIDGDFNAR